MVNFVKKLAFSPVSAYLGKFADKPQKNKPGQNNVIISASGAANRRRQIYVRHTHASVPAFPEGILQNAAY